MKIKTSELTGKALAYAAFCAGGMSFYLLKHCEYPDDHAWVMHGDGTIRNAVEVPSNAMSRHYGYTFWSPHEDWSQGGPIIEREMRDHGFDVWRTKDMTQCAATYERGLPDSYVFGPTTLIAAMRCFVASRLGDEVDVPEELL